MNIRWFPAAWLLIEHEGNILYIDPAWVQHNFDKHPSKIIYSHYPEPLDGLPEANMPKADIILVTHHHQDHVKTATLNRLSTEKTKIYAPAQCAALIAREYTIIKPEDTWKIGPFTITATYAYNTPQGHSTRKPHKRGKCTGYIVESAQKRLYHAGDTDYIPEMDKLKDIDVAFLPVGGTFTMDIDEAIGAAEKIKAKMTIPMHFLHTKPADFAKQAQKRGIRTKTLEIGEKLSI